MAGDDSDLSNLTYSLGDVPIAVGNVARSYKHKPNNSLNAILTTIALVALFFALGIGLGDFIGKCLLLQVSFCLGSKNWQKSAISQVKGKEIMLVPHSFYTTAIHGCLGIVFILAGWAAGQAGWG